MIYQYYYFLTGNRNPIGLNYINYPKINTNNIVKTVYKTKLLWEVNHTDMVQDLTQELP